MRRDQLEHATRTAYQIIGRPEVIVVGSQSILGTFGGGRAGAVRSDALGAAGSGRPSLRMVPFLAFGTNVTKIIPIA